MSLRDFQLAERLWDREHVHGPPRLETREETMRRLDLPLYRDGFNPMRCWFKIEYNEAWLKAQRGFVWTEGVSAREPIYTMRGMD